LKKVNLVFYYACLLALTLIFSGFLGCSNSAQKNANNDKKSEQTTQQSSTPPATTPNSAPSPSTQPITQEPIPVMPEAAKLPEFKAQLDEKSRAIMTAAAEAYGGLTTSIQIRDLTIKAKTAGPSPLGGQLTLDMIFYLKAPDKLKSVTSGIKEGQKITVAYDGKVGWTQLTMGEIVLGTQELPKEQLRQFNAQLTQNLARVSNPFIEALKQDKYAFKFIEMITLESGPADVIELTPPDGKVARIYIDQKSHDVIKSEQSNGQEKVETVFGNFRLVEGRRTPFQIKTVIDGKLVAEMRIEEMQINTGLDDTLFAKPSK
jgi:outer membrane lipoprotein-sorting protein